MKFGLPMASSVTVLLWGALEFKGGYVLSGELDNMLDSVKWPLDYFIKCHTNANTFYGQVLIRCVMQ